MFKNRKQKAWFRLDNVAKIFPPTSNQKDPRVFRFVCELYEDVNPDILASALEKNRKLFPSFFVILKKGLFWYYLEETNIKPKITIENLSPCSPIYESGKKDLLFRVQYYHNRISLEVYHALTDGTGAIQFLKSLITFYLIEKENISFNKSFLGYDGSKTEQMKDSFQMYYEKPKKKKREKITRKVYKIKQVKLKNYELSVIEGHLKLDQLLTLTHQYSTTITIFLTAVFIKAMLEEMSIRDRKKIVRIMIPINLRKHFSSVTMRNFFSVCYVNYIYQKDTDLSDIISVISKQLKKELETTTLEETVNKLVSFEQNSFIRIIPLGIKNLILKAITKVSSDSETAVVSNVGSITMPEELQSHIKNFHVFVSTIKKQICICSYLNQLSIGFTSHFSNVDIEKRFFRILSDFGLEIEIATNLIE